MDKYNKFLNDMYEIMGNDTTWGITLDNVSRVLFGKKFHGVYPSDKIPKLTKRKPYAIINLDTSKQNGSHWVGLAKVGGVYIVYDSFGRSHTKILPNLKLKNIIDTEKDAEQYPIQLDCGARSVAWLLTLHHYGVRDALSI